MTIVEIKSMTRMTNTLGWTIKQIKHIKILKNGTHKNKILKNTYWFQQVDRM